MKKISFYLLILAFLIFSYCCPTVCLAVSLEDLKADFLQGNYRRVIFEGQSQVDRMNIGSTEELNYILGLSYLKEQKIDLAQICFRKILNNQKSKFKAPAALGLADTFLITGQFQEAEEIYGKLLIDQPDDSQKAAILYRLSQLEFKRSNNQQGNRYLSELRKDFPLCPELKLSRGIEIINRPPGPGVKEINEYSVQVGFFSNQDNAGKLKAKLLAQGFPAYIEDTSGGYRVRVGKFKTQNEVLYFESKLSKEGFQTKVFP